MLNKRHNSCATKKYQEEQSNGKNKYNKQNEQQKLLFFYE